EFMNKIFFYGVGIFLGGALLTGCANAPSSEQAEPVASAAQHGHDHEHSMHESEVMHAHVTKLQFRSAPATLQAGKAADWTLLISDADSGKPIPKFEVMHD